MLPEPHFAARLRRPLRASISRLLLCALAGIGLGTARADETAILASVQNHSFVRAKQDGYTNGVFLSALRLPSPGQERVEPGLPARPLLALVGMSQPTLTATSLEQIMITPRDLEQRNPPPEDTPYVGLLLLRMAGVRLQDNVADTVAFDFGVMGPGSGAEKVQKAIHHLNGATHPEGWDTQGPTRGVAAFEGYRAWRFAWDDTARPAFDFTALAGLSWGNRESSFGSSLLLRYGTDLLRSFPSVARVVGRSADPFAVGRGWFAFGGFSADRLLGDKAFARGEFSAQPRKSQIDPMLGFAYAWQRASLSVSLHSTTPLVEASDNRQRYGSVTLVWRMD